MRRKHDGWFITFEGTSEGIGKSTHAKLLAEKLVELGYEVVLTREPGGTPIGRKIRELLLDPSNHLSKACELFLLMADRSQHYKEVLKPALKEGKVVISDRYFDSTLAYQGAGRGWKSAFLYRLHHASTGSLMPDRTIVLEGKPHVDRKAGNPDRIERMEGDFHARVGDAYRRLFAKEGRYSVIDVTGRGTTNVSEDVLRVVLNDLQAERGFRR